MNIRYVIIGALLFIFSCTYEKQKFKVVEKETGSWRMIFELVDENGNVIRTLDTNKYVSISLNRDEYRYFAIFGLIDSSGYYAINANEEILFEVYNTTIGEPNPDNLIENKIRVVGTNERIGFANEKGEVIIDPQFESVSSFHNGKAIIGQSCKKVALFEHSNENDFQHYLIECEKNGYIDEKGIVKKIGSFSFEQIMKEIDWEMPTHSR